MRANVDSQVIVPQAFVDPYLNPGTSKLSLPCEEVAMRHELCEDLAQALVDRAKLILWQLGITEQDVIERMLRGLAASESGLSNAEAAWVVRRLVELLEWKDVSLFHA